MALENDHQALDQLADGSLLARALNALANRSLRLFWTWARAKFFLHYSTT